MQCYEFKYNVWWKILNTDFFFADLYIWRMWTVAIDSWKCRTLFFYFNNNGCLENKLSMIFNIWLHINSFVISLTQVVSDFIDVFNFLQLMQLLRYMPSPSDLVHKMISFCYDNWLFGFSIKTEGFSVSFSSYSFKVIK